MANYYHSKQVKPLLAKLRGTAPADLGKQTQPLRREQFALRVQRATGGAAKPDQFGKVRRNIARLKTVQGQAARAALAGGKQ